MIMERNIGKVYMLQKYINNKLLFPFFVVVVEFVVVGGVGDGFFCFDLF